MRANEALKESKDGVIWLAGNAAKHRGGFLIWGATNNSNICHVCLSSTLSDNWQPSRPVEKCEACKEIDRSPASVFAAHLRQFHCVCKKEG